MNQNNVEYCGTTLCCCTIVHCITLFHLNTKYFFKKSPKRFADFLDVVKFDEMNT